MIGWVLTRGREDAAGAADDLAALVEPHGPLALVDDHHVRLFARACLLRARFGRRLAAGDEQGKKRDGQDTHGEHPTARCPPPAQSMKGSRTRMVSSRSGLVETSATGVSISSCTRLMYLIALAGRSAQLRAPAVLSLQPSSSS